MKLYMDKKIKEKDKINRCITDNGLSENNKKLLFGFSAEQRANNCKDRTILNIIQVMARVGKVVKKDYIDFKREDIIQFFEDVKRCNKCRKLFSQSNDECESCNSHLEKLNSSVELWYKKALKQFFRWLDSNNPGLNLYGCTSWLDTRRLSAKCSSAARKKREDALITPQEVQLMIEKATLLRDKFAIALLADTGVRAETIGATSNDRSISIGQIEFKGNHAIIHDIEEKGDKKRDIIVTEALGYLIKYFNEHPCRDNPQSPLFIGYSKNRRHERWGYTGLHNTINTVSVEAIGRKLNPHDFRHLKATRLQLDDDLSDDAKCKLMGWSSVAMLQRYRHTTFNDAKDEFLAKKGLIEIAAKSNSDNQSLSLSKTCSKCQHINTSTDMICESCGLSLNIKEIIKAHSELEMANANEPVKNGGMKQMQVQLDELQKKLEKKNQTDLLLNSLLEDKDLLGVIVNKIKEKNLGENLLSL